MVFAARRVRDACAIDGQYLEEGGSGGRFGFPTSNEYDWNNGRRSDFEGGYVFWDGSPAQTFITSQPGGDTESCSGVAWVFYDPNRAYLAGHVAWGFSSGSLSPPAMYGSVDGARDEAHKNAWVFRADSQTSMLDGMRSRKYPTYAFRAVENCDWRAALRVADGVSTGSYSIISRDCLDATYAALHAFGVPAEEMPEPWTASAPRYWFEMFVQRGGNWTVRSL